MNLRVTVEGFGARGVAARQGLVPLHGQGSMVDALGVAPPLEGAVRARGPVLAPSRQLPGVPYRLVHLDAVAQLKHGHDGLPNELP